MDPTRPDELRSKDYPEYSRRRGPLVGVNISGLLYMGGYTRNNMFGLQADYREFVRRVIGLFIGKGASVVLVPHVFGSGDNSESDLAACNRGLRAIEIRARGKNLAWFSANTIRAR